MKFDKNEAFRERQDYSQIWLHQFLRAKVLKTMFRQFPRKFSSAKDMDTFIKSLELPDNQKLYVSEANHVVFGESTTRGKITQNCAESIRKKGWRFPDQFQVSEKSIVIGEITQRWTSLFGQLNRLIGKVFLR